MDRAPAPEPRRAPRVDPATVHARGTMRPEVRPHTMSDHATTAAPDAHAAGDDGHGDHHAGDALGPVDWRMWLVGVVGVAVAVAILVAFAIATRFNFADLVRLG
jgi:hypothetical protein